MNSNPYNVWFSLYNEDIENTWYSQPPQLKQLGSAAMLLKALQNQFKKIYKDAEEMYRLCEHKVIQEDESPFNNALNYETENILCNKRDADNVEMCVSKNILKDLKLNCASKENQESEAIISQKNSVISTSPRMNRLPVFKKTKKCTDSNYFLLNANKTPKNMCKLGKTDDVIDSTVIENTPETIPKKAKYNNINRKSRRGKHNQKLNNTTLTQMFPVLASSMLNEDNTDATYCPNAMEMTSSLREIEEKNCIRLTKECDTEKNLFGIPKENKQKAIFKEPPVLGKARLQLEGWNCENCKAFYDELKLNISGTKQILNKCSKHRSKFEPVQFTPRGLWDLNFVTQLSSENNLSNNT